MTACSSCSLVVFDSYINPFYIVLAFLVDGRFACHCGRSYKYKRGWYQHRKYECGKAPVFKCLFCPYKAHQKGSLAKHIMICKFRTEKLDRVANWTQDIQNQRAFWKNDDEVYFD